MNNYDVMVIGGGPAGVCAALAAARGGSKTLLITDRPILGGNSSSEVRIWTRGATGGGNLFAEEMGIWGELKLENLARNPIGSVLAWDDVLLDAVLHQEGLELRLNTLVTDAAVRKGMIQFVETRGIRTESSEKITAGLYVDCTGDGFIARLAGVSYRLGREDRACFGEPLALQKADQFTQGCSIVLQSKRIGRPTPYTAPDYAYTLKKIEQLVGHGGRVVYADMQGSDCWWFEYGGQLDVIADDQKITLELRAIALGIWNYIKNSGKFDAEDLQLEWMGYYPGRRGSRRMTGAETLVQQDVTEDRLRHNAVAYGGWYMDSHPSGGLMSEKEQCQQRAVHCYGIPLGCLYHPAVKNLLFAGRCASMSYVAYTSARIMNTCALMGQAAGAAAAMCKRLGASPQTLHCDHLDELRARLALDDALLCETVCGLPADTITASSQCASIAMETTERLPLSQAVCLVYPCVLDEPVHLWLTCESAATLTICFEETPLPSRRAPFSDNAKMLQISLPQGRSRIALPTGKNCFMRLRMEPNPQIVLLGGTPLTGVIAGYEWEAELFHPLIELGAKDLYSPANVQDGYLRPWNGTHAWVSSGVKEAGETLTLCWHHPIRLSEAVLFFDPDLSMELSSSRASHWDSHHHYAARESMPPSLIKCYELIAHTAFGDKVLATVENNVHRRNVHVFKAVECSGLTLRVLKTYGGDAVVYAVLINPNDSCLEGGIK